MASKWVEVPLEQLKAQTKSAFAMGPFGSKIKAENFTTEGVPVIKGGNLNSTYLDESSFDFLTQEKANELESAKARRLDIVITHRGTLGQVGLIPEDSKYEEYVVSQSQLKMSFDIEKVDPYFIYYFLRSPLGQSRLLSNTSQVGVPAIAQALTSVRAIEIPLPPDRADQVRASKVLRNIDQKIDVNNRINQTLEAMAQAIFKSWFVDFDPVKAKIAARQEGRDPLRAAMCAINGKSEAELDALPRERFDQLATIAALFPDEVEEPELGEIPRGWSYKALAQLTDKIGSGATPRGGKEVYLEEGVALIRSQNVYDSLFVWDGLARISDEAAIQLKGVTVQEDDVLLNITGASILRTCVVEPDALPARVNQHVAIIRAKAGVPPRFIHMHLLRPDIKSYLLGLNAGASREAITKAHIESLTVLTPGPQLLAAFQTATDPLFRQVQRFAQQMRVLGELRDTLLPKLLSGELAVTTPIESAGDM